MWGAIVDEIIDILGLKGLGPQGPPSGAPGQKLPNEKPINGACCFRQSRHLIKVPVILAMQPLHAWEGLPGSYYAEVADGLPPLRRSITMCASSHSEC